MFPAILVQWAAAWLIISQYAHGHMQMMQPYPIRSEFDPANKQSGDIDYSMTSPLLADGSNFPCKGYQNDRPIRTTATYQAGSNYTMTLAGSAMHGGGSCQISLSYDNGKTFHVIKSLIGGCPLTTSFDFHIPSYAPAAQSVLLAWSWQNLIGNREYYMNCAEVEIENSSVVRQHGRRHTRRLASSSRFNSLPYLWKANLPDQNACETVEQVQVVYPHPGPDVVYGSGMNASSPPTPGNCDSPDPPGATYEDLPTTGAMAEPSSAPGESSATGGSAGSGYGISTSAGGGGGPTSGSTGMSGLPKPTATVSSISPVQPSHTGINGSNPSAGGTCGAHDTLECLRNGNGFALCNNGVWTDMGSVAPGTKCVDGAIYESSAGAAGTCGASDTLECLRSGSGFALCNNGVWTDMGSVAPGTKCVDGAIGFA